MKRFVEKQDGALELYYLPTYSPELNPDELVWNDLKNKALGRKVITSRAALQKLAVSHLRWLQKLPRLFTSFFYAPSTLYAIAWAMATISRVLIYEQRPTRMSEEQRRDELFPSLLRKNSLD